MKNLRLNNYILALFFLAPIHVAHSETQEETVMEKLERQGISIGGLSDSPHQNREDITLSDAEKLLWETDQLSNINKLSTLRYQFERTGTLDTGFTDSVELTITKVKDDGMKSAAITFFTDARNQKVAPNENTNGNPVLGVYLQGDVYEMNRLTEGNWRYFHKRIKFALADTAKIEPVTIQLDGKELSAQKVTIRPYEKDERRKLFEEYADKVYEITVSEDVPGMLYEIHTIIPGAKQADGSVSKKPLVEERLVFTGMEFSE